MPTARQVRTLTRLLKDTQPEGAYAVGLIAALADRDEWIPPAMLLQAASECRTVREALELYRRVRMASSFETPIPPYAAALECESETSSASACSQSSKSKPSTAPRSR